MATGQLRLILRHVHELASTPAIDEQSDAQLLERFVRHKEEPAFAALVRRHGSMVLGVCRRVLRNLHDAEDAFQATFLVLLRRASHLKQNGSLAGWLYTVAYHAALKAKAQSTRHGRQQREITDMPAEPDTELIWRDLQPIIDEELDRLPEKYRDAIIQCYMQDKTCSEAGNSLGCPAGTVKSRLARARKMLQSQLQKRGVTLTATMLAAVLSDDATAAVSVRLLQSTVRAALLSLSGDGGGRAAALAEGVVKNLFPSKITTTIATGAIAAFLALGTALLVHQANAKPPTGKMGGGQKVEAKSSPEKPLNPHSGKIRISGRVLSPNGKAVKGAEIIVVAHEALRFGRRELQLYNRAKIGGRTATDANGGFSLDAVRVIHGSNRKMFVVAAAKGYGVGWTEIDMDSQQAKVDVQLHPEQLIRGRIIDLQGQPIKQLRIQTQSIRIKSDRLGLPAQNLPGGAGVATTDDDGRFIVRGIGRDMALHMLTAPHFGSQELYLDTSHKKRSENLSVVFGRPQVVEGLLTAEDTGEPIKGARISVFSMKMVGGSPLSSGTSEGKTDDQGRFQIAVTPGTKINVHAIAPPGTMYLNVVRTFQMPNGAVHRTINVTLPRGVMVRGKITNAATGKPIPGAFVICKPIASQVRGSGILHRWDLRVRANDDGTFALGAVAGRNHLLVTGPAPEYIPEVIGSADILLGKRGGDPMYFHAVLPLDLKKNKRHDVAVKLRPGVTIRGRLVGPDGQPIRNVLMIHGGHPQAYEKVFNPVEITNGRFVINGCEPNKKYRLHFLQHADPLVQVIFASSPGSNGGLWLPNLLNHENKFAATVEVAAGADKDIVVKMQPCGAVKLQFRDNNGKAAETIPFIDMVANPGPPFLQAVKMGVLAEETLMLNAPYGSQNMLPRRTDKDGNLTIRGLIPGMTYQVYTRTTPEQKNILARFTVESGKTKNVRIFVK